MQDRFARGFVAGVAGGVIASILSTACRLLNIAVLCFPQWAGFVLYGRVPDTFFEHTVATIAQLLFSGILGVIFVYILTAFLGSTNYLFKGIIYGIAVWFVIYGLTLIAQVPGLQGLNAATAFVDIISASAYGLVLGETLKQLELRQNN